jgi:hypothetical protein
MVAQVIVTEGTPRSAQAHGIAGLVRVFSMRPSFGQLFDLLDWKINEV